MAPIGVDFFRRESFVKYISNPFSVQEFISQWQEQLTNGDQIELQHPNDETAVLSQVMQIPEDVIKELEGVCAPPTADAITTGDKKDTIPDHSNLLTLKIRKKVKEKCQQNRQYKLRQRSKLRNAVLNWELSTQFQNAEPLDANSAVTYPDVIFRVFVYRPMAKSQHRSFRLPMNVEQEFLVRGNQMLTELRDKVACVSDLAVCGTGGDFSATPNLPQDIRARDIYKSGFFFINNVFYNDMRDPNCRDYSKNVLEWAKQRGYEGHFSTKRMEETKFSDLTIRLGFPYVYQHQGDCEHLIVFYDMRMLDRGDCQDASRYPVCANVSRKHRVKCQVCEMYTAKWVTYSNSNAPIDPCHLCDACFKALNYDAQGNKHGTFDAYPYVDIRAIL